LQKITTIANLGLILLLISSVIGLVLIINHVDPQAKTINPIILYADILVLIFSLTYLLGFLTRRMFGARERVLLHMQVAMRQSLWFGILIVASFLLLSQGLFSWLNASFLVLCLIFLESYFLFR
jgi:hypothetical protein